MTRPARRLPRPRRPRRRPRRSSDRPDRSGTPEPRHPVIRSQPPRPAAPPSPGVVDGRRSRWRTRGCGAVGRLRGGSSISRVGPARSSQPGQLIRVGPGAGLRTSCLAPGPVLEGWAGGEARGQAERVLMSQRPRRRTDLRVAAVAVVRNVGAGVAVVLEGHEWTGERTGWGWLRHPAMIPPRYAKPSGTAEPV